MYKYLYIIFPGLKCLWNPPPFKNCDLLELYFSFYINIHYSINVILQINTKYSLNKSNTI